MKAFFRELKSAALTLALPLAVALVFPYEAVSFRARSDGAAASVSGVFVSLTAEEEREALGNAKSSWRRDASPLRVRLSLGVLPSADDRAVLADRFPRPLRTVSPAAFGRVPYAPSVAAPDPSPAAAAAAEAELVFPRAELLELKF